MWILGCLCGALVNELLVYTAAVTTSAKIKPIPQTMEEKAGHGIGVGVLLLTSFVIFYKFGW